MEVKDIPKILVQMFKDKKDVEFVRKSQTWNCAWLDKDSHYSFAIGVILDSEEEYLGSVEILVEDFNKQDLSMEEVLGNIEKAFKEYIHG